MLVQEHKSSSPTHLASAKESGVLLHGRHYNVSLVRVTTESPGNIFPPCFLSPKLCRRPWAAWCVEQWLQGTLTCFISELLCLSPLKLPELATGWNCVNLSLAPADQQPAISQASSTCVRSIESFLWGYCLRLQTMEGNQEPVWMSLKVTGYFYRLH